MRPLGRVLQHRQRHLIGIGPHRAGMGAHRLGPGVGHGGPVDQQRLVPDQADGQHLGQRAVRAARHLRLPEQPARVLRPAAQIHQQAVKGRFGRRLGQAQPVGGAQDRALRRVGGLRHMGAEAAQPGDLGRQVVGSPDPPGRQRPRSGPRQPQGLPPVEMPRCPQAQGLFDDRRPVGSGGLRGKVGHGRQGRRDRIGFRGQGKGHQGVHRFGPQGMGTGQQGGRQIALPDLAVADGRAVIAPRLRRPGPAHPAQPGRGRGQILGRLPQKGVHRHRGVQRKGRGNGAHRRLGQGHQRGDARRRDVGVFQEHGVLHGVSRSGSSGTRRWRGPAGR